MADDVAMSGTSTSGGGDTNPALASAAAAGLGGSTNNLTDPGDGADGADGEDDEVEWVYDDEETECTCAIEDCRFCDVDLYTAYDRWVYDYCGCERCLDYRVTTEGADEEILRAPLAVHRHWESSYKATEHLSFDQQKARLRYDKLTAPELRLCVLARGLEDPMPGGTTLRYYYLRALEAGDQAWTFRFMDLPPELRSIIYGCLLLQKSQRNKRYCYPNIIRTCKQISEEATKVLYNENIFECRFDVEARDHHRVTARAHVHNLQQVGFDYESVRFGAIKDYPAYLRRVSYLEITLVYSVTGTKHVDQQAYLSLNKMIYALSSFLMSSHSVKTLGIRAELSPDLQQAEYDAIFYPLLRLRNIPNVVFSGHVPERYRKKLTTELRGLKPVFNTLEHMTLVRNESQAQIQLWEELLSDDFCTCGACDGPPPPAMYELLIDATLEVHQAVRQHSRSATLESNMQARLVALEGFLSSAFDAQEIAAKAIKAARAREAREGNITSFTRETLDEAAKRWAGKRCNKKALDPSNHDSDWTVE